MHMLLSGNFSTLPYMNINPNSLSTQPIDFDIVNNNGLSQDDHQVTNISLVSQAPYRVLSTFLGLHRCLQL